MTDTDEADSGYRSQKMGRVRSTFLFKTKIKKTVENAGNVTNSNLFLQAEVSGFSFLLLDVWRKRILHKFPFKSLIKIFSLSIVLRSPGFVALKLFFLRRKPSVASTITVLTS